MIAVALSMAVAPAPLSAQKPGDDPRARAHQHYDRAVAYDKAGDWDQAVAEYQIAQSLYPDPEFDFLIAEVEVKRGNKQAAIERYDRYLAAEPNGRVSQRARDAVARLRAEIEPPQPQPPQPRGQAAASPGDKATSRAKILRLSAYGAGIVGVVALGAGIKFGLDARSSERDVEERWDARRFEEGQAADRKMKIWTTVGAVALVGGGVLYYLGHRADRGRTESPIALAGQAGPGFVGLLVRGGF